MCMKKNAIFDTMYISKKHAVAVIKPTSNNTSFSKKGTTVTVNLIMKQQQLSLTFREY